MADHYWEKRTLRSYNTFDLKNSRTHTHTPPPHTPPLLSEKHKVLIKTS